MYSLFVCGTPHNKKGFELTVLEGSRLPDGISQYIDIYDSDKMKEGGTYVIQTINILKQNYTLIVKYVSINPSDQRTSRGAYIATGILVKSPIALSSSIVFLSQITNLHTSLQMMRDERNAFNISFDISKDLQNIKMNCDGLAFLANLAYSISNLNDTKKVIFNDMVHSESIKGIDNNLIMNEIEDQKKLILEYKEELEDEKEAHRLTIREFENEISELKNQLSLTDQNTFDPNDNQNYGHMRQTHTTAQSRSQVAGQSERSSATSSRRKNSSNINYQLGQSKKKKLSLTTVFLYILMSILLIYALYFLYGNFIETNQSETKESSESISNRKDNSGKNINTIEVPQMKVPEVVSDEINDREQEVEEMSLEYDKKLSTLDKLKEIELKKDD